MVMASLAVDAHESRVYYAALLAAVDGVAPDKHRRLRSGVGNEICVTVVAAFVGRGGCDFWHILCLLHRGWRPCNEYSVEQVFWLLLAPHARSSMGDMLAALCCVHSMNGFLCYFRLVTYLSFKCVVRAASFHPSRVSVLISSYLTVPRLQLSLAPCGGLRVRYVHHCTVSRLILW